MSWLLIPLVVVSLVALGAPLYVIIGATVFVCYAVFPVYSDPWGAHFEANFDLTDKMVELIDQPALVAIPFFMIAGAIMGRGAIATRLVEVASAVFSWLPGGLAISAIFACVFFAAISGSSPVTVVTIGAVMIPALKAAGYGDKMAHGLVTAAGGLGIVIPPSIPMVVFAIYATMSGHAVTVEDMFLAGIIPGIIIALILSFYCMVAGRKVARQPFSFRRLYNAILDGVWALFLPLFILGGIYLGVFDAIEAAAMSVVVALIVEIFIHKSLRIHEIPRIMSEMSVLMGAILLIITLALGFAAFVEHKDLANVLVAWLADMELSPLAFALILNVVLLLIGCLLDIISAIVLLVPILVPLAVALGFDPLHIGIIFIVNLEIGYLTPPLGLNLFVATTYFNKPFGFIVKAVLPFLLMMLVSLLVLTYVPTFSLAVKNVQQDVPVWTPFPTKDDARSPEDGLYDEGTMQHFMDTDDEILELLKQLDGEGGGLDLDFDLDDMLEPPPGEGDPDDGFDDDDWDDDEDLDLAPPTEGVAPGGGEGAAGAADPARGPPTGSVSEDDDDEPFEDDDGAP